MMRNRTVGRVLFPIAMGLLTGACSDGGGKELELIESPPVVDLDEEHKRIAQMQLIRVQDLTDPEDPVWKEVPRWQLDEQVWDACESNIQALDASNNVVFNSCAEIAGEFKEQMCRARMYQTVTQLRAEPLRLGAYLVPPQSAPANISLLAAARTLTALSMDWRMGAAVLYQGCSQTELQATVKDTEVSVGRLLSEFFVDAYHFYREVAEQQVDMTLSVADSERGSSPNMAVGQARAFAQATLSRAAAAHSLVGGIDGIHGDETQAFCDSPELSAQGQRALQVLRSTGVAPALVTAEDVPIFDFLNGSPLTVQAGSIRERYKAFLDPELPDGDKIEDRLGLSVADFISARQYLASEIKAFARSESLTGSPAGSEPIPEACLAKVEFQAPADLNAFDFLVQASSSWTLTDGTLKQSSNADRALAVHESETIADGYVEARIASGDNDSAGVIARYQDDNYYQVRLGEQGQHAYISRVTNGVEAVLADTVLSEFDWAAPGHLIRLSLQGERLTASLDGRVIMAAEDATYASGRVGLLSRNQEGVDFDNFAVYSTTRATDCSVSDLPGEFAWYPATGNAPSEQSHEYWASLARFDPDGERLTYYSGEPYPLFALNQMDDRIDTDGSLAAFLDTSLYFTWEMLRRFQGSQYASAPDAFIDEMSAPLIQLMAQGRRDRPGRVFIHKTDPEGIMQVSVYGYSVDDGLRLVDKDNLNCAVQGNVEGQQCVLTYNYGAAAEMPATDLADFTVGVRFIVDDKPGQRLYVVKPFKPADLRPGQFEALAGFEQTVDNFYNTVIPIVPDVAKRAAEALKPSLEWCSYPAVECDGEVFGEKVAFDARVPLENELTTDGDNRESSWRRYLALARTAADEAHQLAESYMRNGLELDQLDQSEQLRQANDRIRFMTRAEGELEQVQNICGTAIETTALINGLRLENNGITSAQECTIDTDCPGIYHVNNECVAGRCIQTPFSLVGQEKWNEGWARLNACIGDASVLDFATIGNTPVCAWSSNNGFCDNDKNGACPSLAKRMEDGTYTCTGSLAADHMPMGQTLLPPITNTIGLNDNSNDLPFTGPCDAIRILRQDAEVEIPTLTEADRKSLLRNIDNYGLFDKNNIMASVGKLEWHARFGNHSGVQYDGKVIFETGQAGLPQTASWPCKSAEIPVSECPTSPLLGACTLDCDKTPSSLLCQHVACTDWDARTPINQRLLQAVWGMHALTNAPPQGYQGVGNPDLENSAFVNGFSQIRVPTRYNLANRSYPPTTYAEDEGPAGSSLLGVTVEGMPSNLYSSNNLRHLINPFPFLWPGTTQWQTAGGGWAYLNASSNQVEKDFWPDVHNPAVRYQVTNSPTEFYSIEPLTMANPWAHDHTEVAASSWDGERDRLSAWDGLSRYDENDKNQWEISRLILRLLNREKPDVLPIKGPYDGAPAVDLFAVPNGRAADFNSWFKSSGLSWRPRDLLTNSFPQMEHLVPRYDYNRRSIWDAAELYCEAHTRADTWVNQLDTQGSCPAVPTITDENDIPKIRASLMCRAELVRRRTNALILQRIPKLAMQNLTSFTGARAFPEIGGEMGVSVAALREALVRFRNNGFDLQQETATLQFNLDRFFYQLKQVGIMSKQAQIAVEQSKVKAMQAQSRLQIVELETATSFWDGALGVSNSVMQGVSAGVLTANPYVGVAVAAVSLASYSDQQNKAEDKAGYQKRVEELEKQYWELQGTSDALSVDYNEFERAKVLAELEFEVYRGTISVARLVSNMKADLEAIDGHLVGIEKLSLQVQRSIGRLASFESSEAAITPQIRGVMAARLDVGKKRYQEAHKRAVRYAFLAKRAIEQRLGVRLAEMREDLPLVEAPQKWESRLCQSTGVDYDALKAADGAAGDMARMSESADPFIGSYVRKLEDVVESYVMKYGFQDGSDEVVISLRDDVANVRKECEVVSQNMLYFSGQLVPGTHVVEDMTVGWTTAGCASGNTCITSTSAERLDLPTLDSQVAAHDISFAAGSPNARLEQKVQLKAGTYRISWYAQAPASGVQAVKVYTPPGDETAYVYPTEDQTVGSTTWHRQHRSFTVPTGGEHVVAIVRPSSGSALRVAAIQLEDITAVTRGTLGAQLAPIPPAVFQLTNESRTLVRPVCADDDGRVFRETHWNRQCLNLCDEGFSSDCKSGREECFWQTEFNLNQRDIERGVILNQSGFARGNFNYRLDGVGLNFVGTGLRACENVPVAAPCYSGGFIPYTLHHLGPYTVTNHTGKQFTAGLFTGTIEHARGLGIERYLTNPLSSTDRELLTPYIRQELSGRPLDGSFRLRVWDAPGVRFEAIEDVQIYLKYHYWTHTE